MIIEANTDESSKNHGAGARRNAYRGDGSFNHSSLGINLYGGLGASSIPHSSPRVAGNLRVLSFGADRS